jgi:hypothetical protein
MREIASATKPSTVLGDGILSDLFGKTPRLTPADALRLDLHLPLPGSSPSAHAISPRPTSTD